MLMTIVFLIGIGLASIVWARYRAPRDPVRMTLFAGVAVIAVSVHRLLTTPPDSLTFRFYVALILAAIVVTLYRARKLRGA